MTNERYIEMPAVQSLIGHDAIISPAGVTHHDVVVQTDTEAFLGEQPIHLGVADVENPAGVLLVPVSWSDYSKRPFQEIRLGAMAQYSGMRVVGLDFPGMGDIASGRGNELTERQIEEARKGRFRDLAMNYWLALEKTSLLDDVAAGSPLPIALWGHSLSTLTVAELAASLPDGREITDFYVSEAMALGKTSVAHLARVFPTEGAKDLKRYQAMNEGMPKCDDAGLSGLVGQVLKQRQSHQASIKALSRGRHAEVVRDAYLSGRLRQGGEGTQHTMVRAEGGIGNVRNFNRYVNSLQQYALLFEGLVLAGEYHGYQDSLPALLAQMGNLTVVKAQS